MARVDKGALELNAVTVDEISGEGDLHRYRFEGAAGQEVTVKIRTGGGGLSGGNLNSPYGTIYGPDGEFVAPLGDTAVRPRRSYNAPLTLKAGTYTIIVGPAEVDRYGLVGDAPYQIEVEGDEPAMEPTPSQRRFRSRNSSCRPRARLTRARWRSMWSIWTKSRTGDVHRYQL